MLLKIPTDELGANEVVAAKIVFPHIMKTGGTSVSEWIQRHYNRAAVLTGASGWKELKTMPRHLFEPLKFVRGHFGSGILDVFGEHNGFTPIALLRNPVERVVSHFWHLKYAPDAQGFEFAKEEAFSLEEYLDHPETEYIVSNYQTGSYSAVLGSPEAAMELQQVSEEVWPASIEVAKAYVDRCEVVGITEDLNGFIEALCGRFAFYPDYGLRKHRSYRKSTELSDAVLRKIRRMNEIDEELYQYAKARAAQPRRHYVLANSGNPNAVGPSGVIDWRPGQPFWGTGWSDVVADERNGHIWSLQAVATMELAVRQGQNYALVFSVFRFVAPFQQEGFTVLCDDQEVTVTALSAVDGGGAQLFAAALGVAQQAKVTIGFRVTRLLAFSDISSDRDDRKRGVALSHLALFSCDRGPAA